ncbi:MAG: hypothetical protein V4488_07125 [Pseudomonadota bacterium]
MPFAGQLSAAMKNRGFHRVVVTGYTGAIEMLASASNLTISSGFNPHGPTVNAVQGATVDGKVNFPPHSHSQVKLGRNAGHLVYFFRCSVYSKAS